MRLSLIAVYDGKIITTSSASVHATVRKQWELINFHYPVLTMLKTVDGKTDTSGNLYPIAGTGKKLAPSR